MRKAALAAILIATAAMGLPATARADNGDELLIQMCYYLNVNPSPRGAGAILKGMVEEGYTLYGAEGILNTATARYCTMYSLLAQQFHTSLA